MAFPEDNDLTFRHTDGARWGAGKGAPLTGDEVDDNFWQVLLLIAALQTNQAQPKEIQSITVEGGQITFTLSDGTTTFGPYDLPQQAFNWRDEGWLPATEYDRFDVFKANGAVYLSLQEHTSASTFDPDASNGFGALYQKMFDVVSDIAVGFFHPGKVGIGLDEGDAMFAYRFTTATYFLQDLPGSLAGFDVAPTYHEPWTVEIYKNLSQIGSYTYTGDSPEGFFTFDDDVQFNADDVLVITRPAYVDEDGKGFTMTLKGKQGTLA